MCVAPHLTLLKQEISEGKFTEEWDVEVGFYGCDHVVVGDWGSTEDVFNIHVGGICWVGLVEELGLDVLDGVEYLQSGVDGGVDNVNKWDGEGITCQTSWGVGG